MNHDRTSRQRFAGPCGHLRPDCMSPPGFNAMMQIVTSPRFHHRRSTISARPSIHPGVRDALVIGLAILVYFAVRGMVHDHQALALENARWLIDLERSLGIFWEPTLHRRAMRTDLIGTLANWVYIWGHWPIIISTLVWLRRRHQSVYAT